MSDHDEDATAPHVFISYSHDSEEHRAWVLRLATRLVRNGVDAVLDQWDLRLGSDLSLFMEHGLGSADRVLVICTSAYAEKANAAQGGVGYERRLLTADLMKDLATDRIIPILRNNPRKILPRFLGISFCLDFDDESMYEEKYAELIYALHGRRINPRPALGPNPFFEVPEIGVSAALRHHSARYESPALSGSVTFNHSNNNGRYTIGSGDMKFTLETSEAGHKSIYVYNDPEIIRSVALAVDIRDPTIVRDGTIYDSSSRARTIRAGDAAVLQNQNGYWAVICVDDVHTRDSSPTGEPSLSFRYLIQPNRTADFINLS